MFATQDDMVRGVPRAERSGRQPISSPTRNGLACGSRMRCLPGFRGRTWAAHLKSSIAAAVLAVPCLVLPIPPAGAACDKGERTDHREAECPGGLRIGPWRSLEEGKLAGIADIDRRRWRDWTWDCVEHVADDRCTRTGSQEMTGRDGLFGSSFLFTAGNSVAPGGRWSGGGPAAPMQIAGAHGANGDRPTGPFGADCARGRPLDGVSLPCGVGEDGSSAPDRYGLGDSLSGVHPYVPVSVFERWSMLSDLGDATGEPTRTASRGDGGEGPLRRWRTPLGTSLAPPDMMRALLTPEEVAGYP